MSLLTPFVIVSACGAVAMGAMVRTTISYRTWGFARTLASLAAVQLVSHILLWSAPWLYGITGHTHVALMSPFALLCHSLVALAFSLLLFHGQRLLARLVRVLVAMLGQRRPKLPRPLRVPRPVLRLVPTCRRGRPRVTRGPPVAFTAATAVAV